MRLEPHTLDKPACPYCGSNANERFGLNLENDQCALIPTNAGSNKCIFLKTNSDNPYQMKRRRDLNSGFGCSVNTEENIIRFAKRSVKLERSELERQIKAYEESGKVEELPPGTALGAVETFVEKYLKLTPLGGDGRRRKN